MLGPGVLALGSAWGTHCVAMPCEKGDAISGLGLAASMLGHDSPLASFSWIIAMAILLLAMFLCNINGFFGANVGGSNEHGWDDVGP